MQSLWQIYKNVVFKFGQPLGANLDFAIVTAHNPRGNICSAGHNAMLDRLLQHDIAELGVLYRCLEGCDVNQSHSEKSWAIATDKFVAVDLAKRHQQNALYWVANNELYLVPALLQGVDEEYIGRFSDKVLSSHAQLAVN